MTEVDPDAVTAEDLAEIQKVVDAADLGDLAGMAGELELLAHIERFFKATPDVATRIRILNYGVSLSDDLARKAAKARGVTS